MLDGPGILGSPDIVCCGPGFRRIFGMFCLISPADNSVGEFIFILQAVASALSDTLLSFILSQAT